MTANKFEEKEYFKFAISKDTMNGLVKIKVSPMINNKNCSTKIKNLYIT
tara:strand:+ start:79 stop:225 length:147 start_codon:yes stop_codon:yes gene_type:complete